MSQSTESGARSGSVTRYFDDRCEFFDDVLGSLDLNQLERDCIDSPEFRRLFRISQLGFVRLLYHAADHTRGTHSIGACAKAKHLVDRLNHNTPKIAEARRRAHLPVTDLPCIVWSERCLISLAALLHDIPHGPLSHDIEKKTHRYLHNDKEMRVPSHYGPYYKHDDFRRNPAMYLMFFDVDRSILARVLRCHSPTFWRLLVEDASTTEGIHLKAFVEAVDRANWRGVESEILPSLLFHLLVVEDPSRADSQVVIVKDFDTETGDWGIGPRSSWKALFEAWYQPYRHDIVGNTLSADLLDYLGRDAHRLGMRSSLDTKLLEYYVLVPYESDKDWNATPKAGCAIDLNDYKRGVLRAERINDIFRLLDFRHEIHEKAVYHRVVQSAISMAARAVALAGPHKPALRSLYLLGEPLHAFRGDESLLTELANLRRDHQDGRPHHAIAQKLIERRVYRPLMIISGDQGYDLLIGRLVGHTASHSDHRESALRLLGAILDSQYFAPLFCVVCWCVERLLDHSLESMAALDHHIEDSVDKPEFVDWARRVMPRRVILWTTPYKQLYKDPAIVVRAKEVIERIDKLVESRDAPDRRNALPSSLITRLADGLKDSESRYAAMWKIYVFISDGLYYAGGLSRLIPNHPCRSGPKSHKQHLEDAQDFVLRAMVVAFEWWSEKQRHEEDARLDIEMSDTEVREILKLFVSEEPRYRRIFSGMRSAVTAVAVENYLHLESDEACRDVRYRFDRPADLQQAVEAAGLPSSALPAIKELLDSAGLDLSKLGHEEVADIVDHVGHRLDELEYSNVERAAHSGAIRDPVQLRKAWREAETDASNGNSGVPEATRSRATDAPGKQHSRPRRPGSQASRLLDYADSTEHGRERVQDQPDADRRQRGRKRSDGV